jgi:hypothetical protein
LLAFNVGAGTSNAMQRSRSATGASAMAKSVTIRSQKEEAWTRPHWPGGDSGCSKKQGALSKTKTQVIKIPH